MTFGTKGMGERGTKRLITVFVEAMSRVASRTSQVYRGEGRRHKSRRGNEKSHLLNPSSHLLSFTHSNAITLKYAQLNGTISSSLSPFTTLCMENGLFLLLPKKKINTNLLGYRRNYLYGSPSGLFLNIKYDLQS